MELSLGVLLMIATLIIFLWMTTRKPKNFPPGPAKWPIVGHIPTLSNIVCARHFTSTMHKRYGEIVGFYALNIPVIFISGYSEVREAILRDDFAVRPKNVNLDIVLGKFQGLVLASGELWKSQRRFTLHHLRNLGFGKMSLEGMIHEEIRAVFDGVDEMSGGLTNDFCYPINFNDILRGANVNVFWYVMAGKRYDYKAHDFKELMEAVDQIFNINMLEIAIYNIFPSLLKVVPRSRGLYDFENAFIRIRKCVQEEIDYHKETINYEKPRDFMDIYLWEIEKQKNDSHSTFNEAQLKHLCTEFFIAGSDTTSNAMSFAMLYMVLYPEAQAKVQQELDAVVGKDRLPSLTDRARLPYVVATIQEVLRLSSLVPTTFLHATDTTEEYITFRGYHIPKDSNIIFDLYGLHHDPKIWKCPDMFIPERFLHKNGNDTSNATIYPFGGGKRVCPSETLARNNIFLFFTAILQRYTLRVPEGHPPPSQEPDGNTVLSPKPFAVKIQLRR